MNITRIQLATLTCVSLACASNPAPVTVSGDAGDRASLAGKWTGEYNRPATGRSGSIVFNLSPSGEAATGDVVMIPRGYGKALVRYDAVETTFAGRLNGDTIEGTFVTRGRMSAGPQTGSWRVKRTSR